MGKKDISLLNELRKNSRASLTVISCNAGVPLSTGFKMLARLERRGIIKRYVALFDWVRLGFPVRLGVFMAGSKSVVRGFLESHANLNCLLRLSGDRDFYAELLFREMMSCYDFIESLKAVKGVRRVRVHFLGLVKQEGFLVRGDEGEG